MPGFMVPPSDDPSEAWLEEEIVAAGTVLDASVKDSIEVVVEISVVKVELGASVVTLLCSAVLVGSAVDVLATVVLGGTVVSGCDSDLLGFGAVVGSGSFSPASDLVGFAGTLVGATVGAVVGVGASVLVVLHESSSPKKHFTPSVAGPQADLTSSKKPAWTTLLEIRRTERRNWARDNIFSPLKFVAEMSGSEDCP